MLRLGLIAVIFVGLSAFSCSTPRVITNAMCNQHADQASCVADTGNSCHWNAKESTCKD